MTHLEEAACFNLLIANFNTPFTPGATATAAGLASPTAGAVTKHVHKRDRIRFGLKLLR